MSGRVGALPRPGATAYRSAMKTDTTPWFRSGMMALLLALASAACGGSSGPSDGPGLRAGVYDGKFELIRTTLTPHPLTGKHEFTFRVREPAASADDVELLSSRLIPVEGPPIVDYLVLDREQLRIEEGEWRIRFPYAEGDFAISMTLQDLGRGSFRLDTGCFGRAGSDAYLGASCLLERR